MNQTLTNIFKGDKVIWMVFFFLCIISVVEVYSASSFLTYDKSNFFSPILRHSMLLGVGFVFMLVTLNIPCKFFRTAIPLLLPLSYILLLVTLFSGHATNDASRWLTIAGISFQPSELAKGTMVLVTAQILSRTQTENGAERHAFWWIVLVCAPMIFMILIENFSTAMLVSVTLFMMMFIGRVPLKQLGGLAGVAVIAATFFILFIMAVGRTPEAIAQEKAEKELVVQAEMNGGVEVKEQPTKSRGGLFRRADTWKARIYKFLDSKDVPPDSIDLNKDGQVAHSRIAIASSNVIGRGPGNSMARDWLSQAFSDFIFAIIIEELGIEGAIFVAFLYIVLLLRAGFIANKCKNNFPAFLAMGIAIVLATQALFNMCVAVGLAPVTGQPLPLISRGGTSGIINCIYIGVLLSISRSAAKVGTPDKVPAGKSRPRRKAVRAVPVVAVAEPVQPQPVVETDTPDEPLSQTLVLNPNPQSEQSVQDKS